jgi:hypothetical protein
MTFEQALESIATNRLPCRHCGKVHEPSHQLTKPGGLAPQWHDPVDRHAYWRMSAAEFARQVLETA